MPAKPIYALMLCLLFLVAACGGTAQSAEPTRADAVKKSEQAWKAELSPIQYHVLREKGTERAFTGEHHDNKADGVYTCAACGLALFDADHKFDSGTGWPSYDRAIASDAVDRHEDRAMGMLRTEITCARCGGHLGHVFKDGPPTTGERFCVNSASLDFKPIADTPAQDTPQRALTPSNP
jgi:peptide-methionine (R)-S-oxide reductase